MSNGNVLPHEETLELIRLANLGDEDALDRLVRHNIALVKSIIRKYQDRGMEYDDLYQTGCIGLVKAVRNYNPEFGVRFSTYAVPMIIGEIKRSLRDDGMIKVSRSMKELGTRAMAAQEELQSQLSRDVSIEEIAKKIGCNAYDVAEALEAMRPHISIYEPIYEDTAYSGGSQTSLAERIPYDYDTEEEIINDIFLKEALSRLEPRDRQIIDMRYFRNMTQSQTARVLGISQVQVSRLESRIIKNLRAEYCTN